MIDNAVKSSLYVFSLECSSVYSLNVDDRFSFYSMYRLRRILFHCLRGRLEKMRGGFNLKKMYPWIIERRGYYTWLEGHWVYGGGLLKPTAFTSRIYIYIYSASILFIFIENLVATQWSCRPSLFPTPSKFPLCLA